MRDFMRWLLGRPTQEDYEITLQMLFNRGMELDSERRQSAAFRRAYLDLRRSMTALACANGRDNPTIEPLKSILNKHDANMKACGIFVPR